MKLYSPVVGDSKTGGTLQLAGNSGTSDDWNLETETTANLELTVNSSVERYLNISNSGAGVAGLSIDGHLILPTGGASTTPALSFGDGDTGLYEAVANELDMSLGGNTRYQFASGYIQANTNRSFYMRRAAGAVATPTYAFKQDTNTGMFSDVVDQIAFSAGGVEQLRITEVAGVGQVILPLQNLAGTPTLAFGDGDSGFYEVSDDLIGISIFGSTRLNIDASGLYAENAAGPYFLNEVATSTNPTFVPNRADTNTGIGWASTDALSLITGGVEAVRIDAARNVGIGVVPQVWAATYSAFQLGGGATFTAPTAETPGGQFEIMNNAYFDALFGYKYILADEASRYSQINGSHSFFVGGAGAADGAISWGNAALKIDNGGHTIFPSVNDAVTPTLAFGDGDTGFYESVDDTLRLATAGNIVATFSSAGIIAANGGVLRAVVPTSIIPSVVANQNDLNTGMGWAAADNISLITGSLEAIRIDANQDTSFTGMGVFNSESINGAINLSAGDDSLGTNNKVQLRFGFNGSQTYPHFITTKHNAATTALNSINFYTSDGTSGGVYPTNAVLGLTIEAGGIILPLANDAATPTLAFGDGDSGFYESADDIIRVSIGGTNRFNFEAGGFVGANAGGPSLRNSNASGTVPTLVPDKVYTTTGIGSAAGNEISLITGATERVRIGAAGGLYVAQIAAADTDMGNWGQIWVRNDVANTLMFTDDAGVDYPIAGSALSSGQWNTVGNDIYYDTGNVAIGISTLESWNANYTAVQFGADSSLMAHSTSNSGGAFFLQNAIYTDTQWEYQNTSQASKYFQTDGAHTFQVAPTGATVTAGSFVALSSYIIISIGTTDFTLIGAASNTVGLAFTATGIGTGTGTASEKLITWTTALTIENDGDAYFNNNVGVGLTPIYPLHVTGSGVYAANILNTSGNVSLYAGHNSTGTNPVFGSGSALQLHNTNATVNSLTTIRLTHALSGNASVQFGLQAKAANTADFFIATEDATAGTGERLRVTGAGLVKIGTTAATTAALHIKAASGNNNNTITAEYASGSAALNLLGNAASIQEINFGDTVSYRGHLRYNNSTNSLVISTNNANAITIDSSQNVGIGITPTHTLDVGNITSQNTLRINGVSTANMAPVLSMFRSGSRESVIAQTLNGLIFANTGGTAYDDATLDAAASLEIGGNGDVSILNSNHLLLPLVNDAATPTLAFGDGDSGFYEGVDDSLRVSIAGSIHAIWDSSGFIMGGGTAGKALISINDSTATVPNLIPDIGDTNTGIGHAAADQLSLIAGGLEMLRLSETGLASTDSVTMSFTGADKFLWISNVYKGVSSGSFALLNEPSSSTNPTLCPNGNNYSTGLGAPASGQLSLITGGVEAVRIDAAQNVAVTGNITQPNSLIGDATVTTTSTTQTALHTFVHATYGAAEYLIQATQGTARHITKVLITHDGTTAISTEYGEVITGASLYTVQVDISGADARLLITTGAATSTVYKTSYTLIEA